MSKQDETSNVVKLLIDKVPSLSVDMAEKLYVAGVCGGELDDFAFVEEWVINRIFPSVVVLNHEDYIIAMTHALRIAPGLAGTDFGSSRQRDLGQLWTDSARGFLGELAIKKLLKQRFNIELSLDFSHGPIEDYLPSDIKSITFPDGSHSLPTGTISIKTTKFNGIWLDIPGAQIEHSNIFVLVKLGISRDHFVGFLKWISFVKDKLIPWALRLDTIDEDEAKFLWDSLPGFSDIPCYIPGFLFQNDFLDGKIKAKYREKHKQNGKTTYVMQGYVGPIKGNKPSAVPKKIASADWEFQSIGKFSVAQHYLANAGSLRYTESDWQQLLRLLHNPSE